MNLLHDLRLGVQNNGYDFLVDDASALMRRAADSIEALERALQLGLRLGESGRHGEGASCPTCHFVREARAALRRSAPTVVCTPVSN